MKSKRVPAKRRWERILDCPPCFGDWNCLTNHYKYEDYMDGIEQYKKCRWREECKAKFHEWRKELDR